MDGQYMFRDQRGLARLCLGFLYAQIAVAAIGAFSAWWTYDLLGRVSAGESLDRATLEADDARAMVVALPTMLLYLAGAIAIGVWIYRANRNAHAVGTLEMEISPGWAVGWYFVPFANLVMPLRAMREIDAASASALPDGADGAGMLLGGWWGAWLAMNMTGWVSFRIAMNAVTADGLRTAALFDLISCLLTIPACLLLAALIGRIQSFQNRAAPTD